jgi:hypothetical protein
VKLYVTCDHSQIHRIRVTMASCSNSQCLYRLIFIILASSTVLDKKNPLSRSTNVPDNQSWCRNCLMVVLLKKARAKLVTLCSSLYYFSLTNLSLVKLSSCRKYVSSRRSHITHFVYYYYRASLLLPEWQSS